MFFILSLSFPQTPTREGESALHWRDDSVATMLDTGVDTGFEPTAISGSRAWMLAARAMAWKAPRGRGGPVAKATQMR